MKPSKPLLMSLLAVAAWLPAHACYTVHDGGGRVIYRSTQAPVDMSRPLHETVPQRFPGGHLVFDTASTCEAVVPEALHRAAAAGPAPLLTDRGSAQAAGVGYATLSRDIVMVQPRDAALVLARGGPVNVVAPAVPPMLARSLASPDTSRMGGPPARGTVITELRDPPVTIIESRDGVTTNLRSR